MTTSRSVRLLLPSPLQLQRFGMGRLAVENEPSVFHEARMFRKYFVILVIEMITLQRSLVVLHWWP